MTQAFELMDRQVEALFTHDAAGRIVRQNEPDGPAAPLFFLGCTEGGNISRVRHDVPLNVAARLDEIAGREPVDAALPERPRCAEAIIHLLGAAASAGGGPAFCFDDVIPDAVGAVRVERDTTVLRGEFAWLVAEIEDRRPCFAVIEDGIAVSVCFSSRRSPRACEAGVETLAEHRGRGYATAVTAAWARAVRDEGLTPLYSTSWDNLASRGVARRLGLVQYGTDWSVR
ncbi:MAG: GNAT family N-acetyltransferase [Dehalococcoidia bacterium]